MAGNLNRCAFIILCTLVAATPLARGSVHLWATTLIQIGTLIALSLLIVESMINKTPIFGKSHLTLPILALLLLAAASTIMSAHPYLALEGFLMLLTYVAIYYITLSTVRSRKQRRVLVYTIICTALFLAVFGLFQRSGLNPFLWWDYTELRYSHEWLTSTYGNHNHMAGFLEMTIPLMLCLFLIKGRNPALLSGMVYIVLILLVCQVLTLSRGGGAATACSLIFMMSLLLAQKRFRRKKLLISLAVTAVFLVLFVLSSTAVVERVLTISEQDVNVSMGGRITAWQGCLSLIKDNPFLGTGPGTFAMVFPNYQPPGFAFLFKNGHNDYLHFITETGLPIILIMVWVAVLFFRAGFVKLKSPSRQTRGLSLGAMTAIFAILIHSISDFNLHIPANIILFTILAATVTGKKEGVSTNTRRSQGEIS